MIRLAQRANNGDADAFAEAIMLAQASLYRVARSYLCSEEDVADAIQETIFSAWKNIRRLKQPEYFKTWLIRILIHECLKIRERKKRELPNSHSPFSESEEKMNSLMESKVSDRREWQPGYGLDFEEMMGVLREPFKEVLVLYYGEEYSVKEIADILKLSEETVRQRLSRGRKEIRDRYFRGEVAK